LSWKGSCSGIVSLPELLVARWNGSTWTNQGNGGTSGIPSAGTVTSSAPINAFSPFAIASTTTINPLPIELGSFECETINDINKIKWTTISETNSLYFEIEHSFDGINFEPLHQQYTSGLESYSTKYYEFIHNTPNSAFNYYRIKEFDKAGKLGIYQKSLPAIIRKKILVFSQFLLKIVSS